MAGKCAICNAEMEKAIKLEVFGKHEAQFQTGYEWDTEFKVDLISSAECMEHVTDPLEFLLKIKQKANAIAITTTLLPEPVPDESWWYYTPQHGQHICFLERRTLEALGKKIKMHVVSYKSMHLFSKSRIETGRFERLMKKHKQARLIHPQERI